MKSSENLVNNRGLPKERFSAVLHRACIFPSIIMMLTLNFLRHQCSCETSDIFLTTSLPLQILRSAPASLCALSLGSDTKLVQIVKNFAIPFSVRTIKQTWGRKLWIGELGKIENDEVEARRCKPTQYPQSRKLEIQESTEDYEVELWSRKLWVVSTI